MTQIYGSGKYKYGLCHVFALALHRVFGYQIAILEDQDREMINDRLHKTGPIFLMSSASKTDISLMLPA